MTHSAIGVNGLDLPDTIVLVILDEELILEAARFLRGKTLRTPVEPSPGLSEAGGAQVWLKLEHLQKTGSFKLRGAWFRLSRLTPEQRSAGIVTCSAGNHGT